MIRVLIVPALLLYLAGCGTQPKIVTPPPDSGEAKTHRAYVINHGWHTGIIVAAEQLQPRLTFIRQQLGAAAYYEFGWGDKAFYTAEYMSIGLALRAALWPSDSVVHVVPLQRAPARYYPNERLVQFRLSNAQLRSMFLFIENSFHYDDAQQALANGRGHRPGSWFFAGAGQYNLTNTCNTWTAKALTSAGLEIDPGDIITADALMSALRQAITTIDGNTGQKTLPAQE